MKTKIFTPPYDDKSIKYCIEEIKSGNIGILPTDTIYGIGCDALNIKAIQNLYNIKKNLIYN